MPKIDSNSIPGQQEAEIEEYGRRDILVLSGQNCTSHLQRMEELHQQNEELKQQIEELKQRVLELEKGLTGGLWQS